MIIYDYPLSEKIRTLLRLENLYQKVQYFARRSDPEEHHAALLTLFEILETGARADLKSDLLQELERQRSVLEQLRTNPAVSLDALEGVLHDMERTSAALLGSAGKFGQPLRENEWLMAIKQRSSIPGGVCEFDLPSYHYWLHVAPEARQRDLVAWVEPILPIYHGLRIVLRLLRESGRPTPLVAHQGVYQQTPAGKVAQMLRVHLDPKFPCVPEISANKHALNIRFITPGSSERPHLYERDVEFALAFCNL